MIVRDAYRSHITHRICRVHYLLEDAAAGTPGEVLDARGSSCETCEYERAAWRRLPPHEARHARRVRRARWEFALGVQSGDFSPGQWADFWELFLKYGLTPFEVGQ